MALLFIEVYQENGEYFVNIKTLIILYIFKLSDSPNIDLNIQIISIRPNNCTLKIDLSEFEHHVITNIPECATLSRWPVILSNNYVVSGLCSVARQICKLSDQDSIKNLLGFREACLVACAESSVWTKFCEIDITDTVEKLLNNCFMSNEQCQIPEAVLKYENHLTQPVRIHNIYKIARDNVQDQSITSSTPRKDLKVPHDFAEGPYISLADIILYPCYVIIFKYFNCVELSAIPLTKAWFGRLKTLSFPEPMVKSLPTICNVSNIVIPLVKNVSLYNADPTRITPVNHTKQYKIENALNTIQGFERIINNDITPYGSSIAFNWQTVPMEVNPKGGSLPAKRADRKCQQLENLTKAVLKVVGDKKYRIVDFCSGSGHLGLLIAYLLPKCLVILVENKEKSLARARETVNKLKLQNVLVVQSNLDYFIGSFQLGIALHACGVASDLVMQMCIKNQADFICCPCCYGGIKDCHEVLYPRSTRFRDIFKSNEEQYFNLAHAADQTHETENSKTKQGYFCMDIIDTDRRLYAEDCGYKVFLGKLQPVSCTNKNNLLVGLYTNVN